MQEALLKPGYQVARVISITQHLTPRRNDNHRGSFSINLAKGCWKDFATNDAKGGDLISMVAYLDNCSQLEAAKN